MEKKIELTENDIRLIEMNKRGEIGWKTSKEDIEAICVLINKAKALLEELNAYDERKAYPDCSLLAWYYDKWLAQNEQNG